MTIRAVIFEDHPFYRDHVVQICSSAPEIEVLAAVASIDAVTRENLTRADVVVLDLGLKGRSGIGAVGYLAGRGLKVLVLSGTETAAVVARAINAGARGYLTKQCERAEFLLAVRRVAGGGTYVEPRKLGPDLAAHLLAHRTVELAPREQQVLALVAEGETDRAIAELLNIKITTVRSYLARIGDKVGLRRRYDLVRYADEHGFTPPSP